MRASFTLGAEADDARDVTVQLKQDRFLDRNLGSKRALWAYVSSDAAGDVAVDNSVAYVGGNLGDPGLLAFSSYATLVKTDATGEVVIPVTTGADSAATVYLNLIDPETGKVLTSGPIAFLDNTP